MLLTCTFAVAVSTGVRASLKVVLLPSPVPTRSFVTESSGMRVFGTVPMKPAVLVPTPAMAFTADGTSST